MIMAGRGKYLGDYAVVNRPAGVPAPPQEETTFDLSTLMTKINEINVKDINASNITKIANSFKKLCTSKDVMKDILSQFHDKALIDTSFGDKFLVAFEDIFNFEVEEVRVRNEILQLMQNDFSSKESLSQSDKKKFLNAVTLLGNGFKRIKICGKPISILGLAMFEYFEFLLKGGEDDMKVLAIQILSNGVQLSLLDNNSEKYVQLQHNLRTTLMTKDLNLKAKCWILLSIDLISNNFKPFSEALKDFYTKELKEEYTKLEPLFEATPAASEIFNSPENVKSQDSGKKENKNMDSSDKKKDGGRRDLSERFSGMSMKPDEKRGRGKGFGRDRKWQGDEKPRFKGNSMSGHDDRFEKDENYYGVQAPRRPKPENPKKSFGEAKEKKAGNEPKTDSPKKEEKDEEKTS